MFSYYDKAVCKVAFLIIHDLGEKELNNLLKHLKMDGPVLMYYNNKGRKPKYVLLFYNIFEMVYGLLLSVFHQKGGEFHYTL